MNDVNVSPGATTTFAERGQGDVLISFESEVNNIRNQYVADKYEVIVPKVNILAEFPVAWVDKNVEKNGTLAAATEYLNYLYSPAAQKTIAGFYYRVNNPAIMAADKGQFPDVQLFKVEDRFGGWPQAMTAHFADGGELDKLIAAGHQ